jgi:EAL domain-containing protein (putative c-di-GMP-specific phosphodiesterase class I)/GGDEF domain-containing protein
VIPTFSIEPKDYTRKKQLRVFRLLLILLLILTIGYVVYVSGGTKGALPHLMYVPIILAALFFGIWGAVGAAIAGALVLGPFMPENTVLGIMQNHAGWMVRGGFFVLMGVLIAILFKWIFAYSKKEREQSTTNLITGLPNANKLSNDIDNLLGSKTNFSLLGFKVENFDDINRYASYDIAIKSLFVAIEALKELSGVTVYSIYVREFAIILQDGNVDNARQLGLQFLSQMQTPLLLDGFNIALIIKCGLVHCPPQQQNSRDVIKKIGIALDHETRGAELQVYDDTIAQERKDRFDLAVALLNAIKNEEFHLVYQPKINLADNSASGVEALLRWNHSGGLQIGPDIFISMAEELGIISEISMWVIRNTISQAIRWNANNAPVKIAINLSPKDLKTPSVVHYLIRLIKESALEPSLIEVELTERALYENESMMLHLIGLLRELGVKISLDDFGTGYNSLIDLVLIPIDYIKIDKSFIDCILCDHYQILIDTVISYAHKSGKKVIAEGVENEFQLDILKNMGCDFVQGYYFSKPLPLNDLEAFLFRPSAGRFDRA